MSKSPKSDLQAYQQKIEQRVATCYALAARAFMAHLTGGKQYLQLFSDWLSNDYRDLVIGIEQLDSMIRKHDKDLFPALELMKTDLKTIIEQSNELGKMAILLMEKR
jgi:hypothetical protein